MDPFSEHNFLVLATPDDVILVAPGNRVTVVLRVLQDLAVRLQTYLSLELVVMLTFRTAAP